MGSVVIRNLDDAIINQFRTKAELREALVEKVRVPLPPGSPDCTDMIRQDRDSR